MNTQVHTPGEEHACCHAQEAAPTPAMTHAAHAAHGARGAHAGHAAHAHGSGWGAAASVTVHCLTGCAIGEFIGLAIGVSLGFPVHVTITLAVVLSFISGFALTLLPMLKRGFGFVSAFQTVWLGEVISISVMEIVMNLVDYHMGGMRGVSLASARYWESFALSLVAGYLAAWPVNKWMLSRNMKKCH
ncbi:MAG: DUF4396 domain-containing protein [Stenotrophobium sp.]